MLAAAEVIPPNVDDETDARRAPSSIAVGLSPLVGEQWVPWPWLMAVEAAVLRELQRPEGGRLIVNAPPRHGKSIFTSHWLPVWFLECNPHLSVILSSYEAKIASRWGRSVRDTFKRPELLTKVKDDSSAADIWETTEGGGMRSCGAGGPLTGSGASLLIIDDPVKNWEEACSAVRRQSLIDWFQSTFYSRCEPGATIVVNMTRWHEDDLTGWLLREHTDDWTHLLLPGLAEEGDPLGRAVGEALCPERYSAKTLERIMAGMGQAKALGLIQQRPVPGGGAIIQREWLKHRYDVLPADVRLVGISVDASFNEGEKNSYVVIQVWGRRGADYFLVYQFRKQMGFVETVAELRRVIKLYPGARAKWIEDKANGPAIISQLRKNVSGLIAVTPKGSKESRLEAASPLFEAGNVWLPSERLAPWIGDYIAELTSFPSAPFDDQVDATSQALLKMSEARRNAGGGFGGAVPH